MAERLNRWKSILGIGRDSITYSDKLKENYHQGYSNIKSRSEKTITHDVNRTRSDIVMFQSEIVRAVAKRALVDYCKYHRIDYMQGLNEVYAVSLSATLIEEASAKANKIPEGEIGHVESTSSIDGEVLTEESYATYGMSLLVFEGIVEKLCPANFSTDGITAVQSQLASFNLLVNFHEPSISVHLRANGLSTDMYAMSWFITLFARRLPLKLALRLWDVLLESSEPDILIYIAVSLLRMRKPELMAVSKEDLPEAMFSLNFRSGEEIRLAYQQALAIKKHTPLSFRRKLAALGFNKTLPDTFREVGRNSLMRAPCLLVSVDEVASALSTRKPNCNCNIRHLVLDCRTPSDRSRISIEGAIYVDPQIRNEICCLAFARYMFAMSSKFNKRELAKISDETIGFLSLIATISDRNKNLNSEVWTSVDHEFIDLVVIGSEKFFGDFDEHTSSLDGEEMNIAEALPRRMISKTRERFLSTAYSIPNNCVEFDLPIDKLTVLVQGLPFDSYEFMSALILLGFPRVCSLMNQDYQNVDSDTVDLSVIYPDYASEWTMILLEHNEPTSVMYHALLLELYKQKCEIIYYDKFSSNKIAEHPVVRTKIDEVVAASIAAFILDTRIPIPNSFLLSGTFRPDGERDPHLKVLRSLRNEFLNGEGMIHKLILRCRVRNNFAFRDSKRGSMIDMLYTLLISVGVRDYNILIGILKEQSATSKGFIDFILHVEPVNEEKARADNMDIMRAVRTMAIGMVQKSVSVRPIDSAKSASLEEACTHLKGLNSNNAKMRQLLGQIDVISTKITAMMK